MDSSKQAYLKCEISGVLFADYPIITFDSVDIGYDFGECLVVKEHIKRLSDKSFLVKLIGSIGKDDGRYIRPTSEEYAYVKMNSIFHGGWLHCLVPRKNIVYLSN